MAEEFADCEQDCSHLTEPGLAEMADIHIRIGARLLPLHSQILCVHSKVLRDLFTCTGEGQETPLARLASTDPAICRADTASRNRAVEQAFQGDSLQGEQGGAGRGGGPPPAHRGWAGGGAPRPPPLTPPSLFRTRSLLSAFLQMCASFCSLYMIQCTWQRPWRLQWPHLHPRQQHPR